MIFDVTLIERDVLGHTKSTGEIWGIGEHVAEALSHVLERAQEGDTIEWTITCRLSVDHPLAGVDLNR